MREAPEVHYVMDRKIDRKTPEQRQAELDRQKAEFFANGGKIQHIPRGIGSYNPMKPMKPTSFVKRTIARNKRSQGNQHNRVRLKL